MRPVAVSLPTVEGACEPLDDGEPPLWRLRNAVMRGCAVSILFLTRGSAMKISKSCIFAECSGSGRFFALSGELSVYIVDFFESAARKT